MNFNITKTYNNAAMLIALLYLLFTAIIPIIIYSTKSHNNYSASFIANNYYIKKALVKNSNNNIFVNTIINTINTATYISDGQMLARQINNNNLQSYINDAKGSALKLNNSDNTNVQNYSYDAYGNIINVVVSSLQETPSSTNFVVTGNTYAQRGNLDIVLPLARNNDVDIPNPFQYNGERFDNNTKLQYLRARFYSFEIKRFLTQDDYDLLNRFGYVNGNPVMQIDPTGHVRSPVKQHVAINSVVHVAGSFRIESTTSSFSTASSADFDALESSEKLYTPEEVCRILLRTPLSSETGRIINEGTFLGNGSSGIAYLNKEKTMVHKFLFESKRKNRVDSYPILSSPERVLADMDLPEVPQREAELFNAHMNQLGFHDLAVARIENIDNNSVLITPYIKETPVDDATEGELTTLRDDLLAINLAIFDAKNPKNLARINGKLACIDFGIAIKVDNPTPITMRIRSIFKKTPGMLSEQYSQEAVGFFAAEENNALIGGTARRRLF